MLSIRRKCEVLLEDALGQPRQLLPGVYAGLDHLGKLAGAFHVGGIDAQVVEGEVSHAPGKYDGQRVRLLPHGRAGVPDARTAAASQAGEEMFDHPLQHLLVSKEEGECQGQNLLSCG
jgi:hypothetical protein